MADSWVSIRRSSASWVTPAFSACSRLFTRLAQKNANLELLISELKALCKFGIGTLAARYTILRSQWD